jgi:hypothetical protein
VRQNCASPRILTGFGVTLSHFDGQFQKDSGKDPTETIILKNIAEKIDDIEKRQSQTEYNAALKIRTP